MWGWCWQAEEYKLERVWPFLSSILNISVSCMFQDNILTELAHNKFEHIFKSLTKSIQKRGESFVEWLLVATTLKTIKARVLPPKKQEQSVFLIYELNEIHPIVFTTFQRIKKTFCKPTALVLKCCYVTKYVDEPDSISGSVTSSSDQCLKTICISTLITTAWRIQSSHCWVESFKFCTQVSCQSRGPRDARHLAG